MIRFVKKLTYVFLLFYCLKTVPADILNLKNTLPKLNLHESPIRTREIVKYSNKYSLRFNNTEHYLGSFESAGFKIAANVYIVENPVGTIILNHGYLSHSGLMSYFIKFFTEQNFNVASFDMPGHGLSGGSLADIDNFLFYSIVLKDFINIVSENLPGPYTLVGHSLGGASIIEYLRRYDFRIIDNIVLLAPLVRLVWYKTTKTVIPVVTPFKNNVKRIYRDSSSDKSYKSFIKNKDPLTITKVPVSWLKALYGWNKHFKKGSVINRKVLIIQGLEDIIVEYKYNIDFLKSKIKDVKCLEIKKAKHDLLNESRIIRTKVYNKILSYISEPRN